MLLNASDSKSVVQRVQFRTNLLLGSRFVRVARNSKFSIGGKQSRLLVCRVLQLMRKVRMAKNGK